MGGVVHLEDFGEVLVNDIIESFKKEYPERFETGWPERDGLSFEELSALLGASSLVGRKEEFARAAQALDRGDDVIICGTTGMGKSLLTALLCKRQRALQRDVVTHFTKPGAEHLSCLPFYNDIVLTATLP